MCLKQCVQKAGFEPGAEALNVSVQRVCILIVFSNSQCSCQAAGEMLPRLQQEVVASVSPVVGSFDLLCLFWIYMAKKTMLG